MVARRGLGFRDNNSSSLGSTSFLCMSNRCCPYTYAKHLVTRQLKKSTAFGVSAKPAPGENLAFLTSARQPIFVLGGEDREAAPPLETPLTRRPKS